MQARCSNDNHGRAVVRVRFCASCGVVVNEKIPARRCPVQIHASARRERSSYCVDCGEGLVEGAR
jgi:hypothetical protein